MSKSYVLDACALIAAIKKEPGGATVADLYEEAEAGGVTLAINKVNLLEVYYGFRKERGAEFANTVLESVMGSVVEVGDVSIDVLKEAGRIKADFKRISIADAVALAETSVRGGYLVTADHHEMDAVDRAIKMKRFILAKGLRRKSLTKRMRHDTINHTLYYPNKRCGPWNTSSGVWSGNLPA